MAAQDKRRAEIETAITTFRGRIEAMLKTCERLRGCDAKDGEHAVRSFADDSQERAEGAVQASNTASDNVEIAAAAAEELLSSISEISRQLGQTNQPGAARRSTSRRRPTTRSAGLATAAQKIGDVVKLIQPPSPGRPTCWRSTPPSRRPVPAKPGAASRWSPPR